MRREGEINPAIFPNTDCIHRINRCILQEYRVTGTNQENESLEEEKNMTTIMTIAAGLGIGYFVYQYLTSNNGGKLNGRIHKSATDKKIAGVCGGIAEWLGVDPTVIRLVWALLICGWGTGLLAYIICAVVLPEE